MSTGCFFPLKNVSCRGSVPFSTEPKEILEGRIVAVSQLLFNNAYHYIYVYLYIFIFIFYINACSTKQKLRNMPILTVTVVS